MADKTQAQIDAETKLKADADAKAKADADAAKAKSSPLPQVGLPTVDTTVPNPHPEDQHFTAGLFKKKSDGETYALCKRGPDSIDRTHHLKNSLHYWHGTEADFKDQFEKA